MKDHESVALSPRLQRLLAILLAHFRPHRNRDIEHKTAIYQNWNWEGCYWCVDVHDSTEHERLEASFALRGWLQEKISPEELTLLMPQDL